MQHLTLEAKAVATDVGEFTALAATYTTDRQGERIVPGAFEGTIKGWLERSRPIPLHWNHSSKAEDLVGYVRPNSMRETDEGLYVEGRLDLEESATAREVWRSMKNGSVALSFGFLTKRERKSSDGVKELLEIDLFEVSVAPSPANPNTRFLKLKSAGPVKFVTFDV